MPGFESNFKKALQKKALQNNKKKKSQQTIPNSKSLINNEQERNNILNTRSDEIIIESNGLSLESRIPLNVNYDSNLKIKYEELNSNHNQKIRSIKRNKSLNIGIIKAHGTILTDKFCLVPDNLQLIIPIQKGISYTHNTEERIALDHSNFLLKKNNRKYLVSDPNNGGSKIILGNTLIHDALLYFSIFYPGTTDNPNEFTHYSFTGIITKSIVGGSFTSGSTIIKRINEPNRQNSMKKYKPLFDEMSNYHNSNIIPSELLFMKKFYLSEILIIISEYKKRNPSVEIPSLFYLLSCRNYNRPLGNSSGNLVRQPSNSPEYISIFYEFCKRIELKLEKCKNSNLQQDVLYVLRFLKSNHSINYETLNFLINFINNREINSPPNLRLKHTFNFMDLIFQNYTELSESIMNYHKNINVDYFQSDI